MSTGPPSIQTFGQWAIFAVIIGGIVACLLVAIHALGIVVPAFIYTLLWIVLAVLIIAAVIRFLMKMAS